MHKKHFDSGGQYSRFVDNDGCITIIKKTLGTAEGLLKDIKIDKRMSDDDSLVTAFNSFSNADTYKV
jgi:hypothetical protein